MKTKRSVKYSLGAVCAVMLLTTTTWAAPAADASEDVLDNIVITATKTEADVRDLPANVSVITAEDIARANVKSVEDILRYQTGFAVKDMGGMKATKVSMRGMSQNGVLVMVDGVSINNGYTGGANWSSVPVEMIERIEIVRGAGSALYGSNAMGGVVNIITKEATGGKITAGFGSHHTRYGDLYYGVQDKDLFFSVNYGKRTTDGYNDDITDTATSKNTYGKRASERETYGMKLAYDVNDENKVTLSHQVTENSYGYYQSTYDPQNEGLRKAIATQLNWQGRYKDGSALNVSLSQYDMNRYWTQSGKNYTPNPVKSREAEANYSWLAGDKHHITVGASYKQDKGSSETWWPNSVLKDRSGGKTENVGFFIQDDISLSERANLIIGGRYDSWEFKNGYNMGGDIEGGDASQFSPKAALNYRANDVTSYYVSIGKAFNSPTLFNLSRLWPMGNTGNFLRPNADLKPEELMMYEVGAKFDLGGKTSATVSLFQNDVENMIDQCPYGTGGDLYWNNVGEARIRGIEAEVNHRFDDEWSGFVSYTYNDSEVREYDADPTLVGNQLTTVPEQEFKLGVTHQKNKWTTNLLARYTSEIYEDISNSTELADMADAVFLMDIKVAYAFDDRQSVSLAIDNLLDREFQCQGFWGDGRAAYMEYSYQF